MLSPDEKKDYETAKRSLLARLDTSASVLAAHYFGQKDKEPVANYVFRLEHTFQVAYGKEPISTETRDMLTHSQLQEGLSYELMQSPVVSGAMMYPELCLVAKNEEKRLATLEQPHKYQHDNPGAVILSSLMKL